MLTLNVIEIQVKSAKLSDLSLKTNQSQNAINISYDTQKQTVSLTFPEELPTGSKAALHLEFTGILNDQMCVFGIPYPLPKCDMVAIPDFEAVAMENWGLITYRTIAILFVLKHLMLSSSNVLHTLFHELAHQWFSNLVTMKWWDHLWLNEGFATWVGYIAVDKIFPDWDIWTQFIMEGFQRGLQLDALRSSHHIEVPVNDPSYFKGASVIRMLSNFIGENIFLAGIRRYLKRHEYSNASTDDLWKALTEESGIDVGQFMTGSEMDRAKPGNLVWALIFRSNIFMGRAWFYKYLLLRIYEIQKFVSIREMLAKNIKPLLFLMITGKKAFSMLNKNH
ncbi:hypothetical protein C2G38_2142835 [Gigaspora rosea]|uniref:Peptidase M1 membrane alanine aminopeptidase domain-containing protein n=1 Tax=Gigaspora rosea TaxID=44941 RepID=A0A397VCE0_9GLOM|nr:hypothetical protein C2G38_2142835 [Gigaspora rosea]